MEIKSWLKNSGVALVKNECCDSGSRTLKLFLSQEGINWFLHGDGNSKKLKGAVIIIG